MSFGEPHIHYMVCDSTNERARRLAATGFPSGTIVTADAQRSGRGRSGRSWEAKAGKAVLYSALLRPLAPNHRLLPLAVPIAVAEAAESVAKVRCEVKWPNDVWIDGRKVAGILLEGRPQDGWAVLGIGLNVTTESFPPELAETATSLHLAGVETTPARVLDDLLASLAHWLDAPRDAVLAAWRLRDALKGERVRWSGGEGIADGIDDSGALLVETGNGRVTLDAGEVHLRR
jgi:BirA family transcriptional regulator, biotin operon repressor / biotin---[acetyl-CoA-carboxylase] ligase